MDVPIACFRTYKQRIYKAIEPSVEVYQTVVKVKTSEPNEVMFPPAYPPPAYKEIRENKILYAVANSVQVLHFS